MLAYFDQQQHAIAQGLGRHHPWTVTVNTPDGRYVDFKESPSKISAVLEDLRHANEPELENAIINFIAWANGPTSVFETNDFGLRPVHKNAPGVSTKALEQTARVTIFFRDLFRNTRNGDLPDFARQTQTTLNMIAPQFDSACWGWSLWPHLFIALGDDSTPEAEGNVIQFSLWSWGDSEKEVQDNIIRSFVILRQALEQTFTGAVEARDPSFDQL